MSVAREVSAQELVEKVLEVTKCGKNGNTKTITDRLPIDSRAFWRDLFLATSPLAASFNKFLGPHNRLHGSGNSNQPFSTAQTYTGYIQCQMIEGDQRMRVRRMQSVRSSGGFLVRLVSALMRGCRVPQVGVEVSILRPGKARAPPFRLRSIGRVGEDRPSRGNSSSRPSAPSPSPHPPKPQTRLGCGMAIFTAFRRFL